MEIWLGFLALIINVGISVRNFQSGLMFFIVFALVLPNTIIGGTAVSYEILGFLPLAALYITRSHPRKLDHSLYLLIAYMGILSVSTIVSMLIKDGELEPFNLLGAIRLVALAVIVSKNLDQEKIVKVISIVALINLALVLIQIAIPESVSIFHQFYFKESARALENYLDLGFLPRCTGSFNSPVIEGAFMMMTACLMFGRFLRREHTPLNLVVMGGAILCGLMAASKLFILGAPIVLFLGIVLSPLLSKKGRRDKGKSGLKDFIIFPVLVVFAIAGFNFVQYLSRENPYFSYNLDFMLRPFDALETRYSDIDGVLFGMSNVISNNLLLGAGKTTLHNEFLGDSSYYLILHDTGMLGAMFILFMLIILAANTIRNRDLPALMIYGALLISGVATTLLLSLVGILVISYVLNPKEDKSANVNDATIALNNQPSLESRA